MSCINISVVRANFQNNNIPKYLKTRTYLVLEPKSPFYWELKKNNKNSDKSVSVRVDETFI